MLVIPMCLAIAAMTLWPDTPAGRFLRRWMVEAPARKLTPGVMIFALFVVLVALATLLFASTDGVFVIGSSLTEGVAWFAAFDIATYIDVLAVAWLLAATVRLRAAHEAMSALSARAKVFAARRIGALCRAGSTRAPRRVHRSAPPPQDDGPGWAGLAFA